MMCSMCPSSRLLWDRGLLVCLVGSFDHLLMNRESLKWRIFLIIAPADVVLLLGWNILLSGRVIPSMRLRGSQRIIVSVVHDKPDHLAVHALCCTLESSLHTELYVY